jgi:hypothetical protein
MNTPRFARPRNALLVAVVLGAAACAEPVDLTLPSADDIAAYYASSRSLEFEISGNVAVITATQRAEDLRRGGPLWAKMGPYIHLFSPATETLLRENPGLAGVRVRTVTSSGAEVASALLERATLNDVTWKPAKARVAKALTDEGAEQVRSIERLVQYGERHTTYEYDPSFARR